MPFSTQQNFDLELILEQIDNQNRSINIHQPQHLCNMCGVCCNTAFCCYEYNYLKDLAGQHDPFATEFLSIFVPYKTLDDAFNKYPHRVSEMIDSFTASGENINDLTIYKCIHVTDSGLCSIHSTRPNLCRNHPNHIWSLVSESCGYYGWLFALKERDKRYIRYLKEYLFYKTSTAFNEIATDVALDSLITFFVTDLPLQAEPSTFPDLFNARNNNGLPLKTCNIPLKKLEAIILKKLRYCEHVSVIL